MLGSNEKQCGLNACAGLCAGGYIGDTPCSEAVRLIIKATGAASEKDIKLETMSYRSELRGTAKNGKSAVVLFGNIVTG